jgi:predicted ATPase
MTVRRGYINLRPLGQLILQNSTQSQIQENIFDIVNQLNHGLELVSDQQQRDEIAKLNLTVGQKAKSSTAYHPTLIYLQQGLEWLVNNVNWQFLR